jgi:hypothetical protein
MQKSTSRVIENLHYKTRRMNQSITAARYTKPRFMGVYVNIHGPIAPKGMFHILEGDLIGLDDRKLV